MKITSFGFTLRQAVREDGYGDNYYVTIDENGMTHVSHPYKSIPYEEQKAIFGIIHTAIVGYTELVGLCDMHNRELKLEEYALIETKAEASSESAVPQSCALGDEEVSTGTDGESKTLAQQVEDNVIESLGLI